MHQQNEATLDIGPRALLAYTRLSYTMWYALAEFIDNATQSRVNYSAIIDEVLAKSGTPLVVEITYDRIKRELRVKDNSIGMTRDDLVAALKVAHPTADSKGRSRYGMGMKTAACWIGKKWKVVTCEFTGGEEWTASVDVKAIADGAKVPLQQRAKSRDEHYTEIIISELHRNIQKRTEETIKIYLGSMYRFDIRDGRLKLIYNGEEIKPADEYEMDTDPTGKEYRQAFETTINGKKIKGWFGVLKKGGRKYGGFSLFQNRRQIQGYPNAWKPKNIYGGTDDEGANNLIAQRLTGLIEVDGFEVSHTKDSILFEADEEQQLEDFLKDQTKDYCDYANRRRGPRANPWSRDRLKAFLENMKDEFATPELKDAATAVLPPLSTIAANNRQQVTTLKEGEKLAEFDILPGLHVVVSEQERSEHDPYVTITVDAHPGTVHVIINGLHPYYGSLEGLDAIDECLRQYIYDAIAEFDVSKQHSSIAPESVRRKKDNLLRAKAVQVENIARSAGAQRDDGDSDGDKN